MYVDKLAVTYAYTYVRMYVRICIFFHTLCLRIFYVLIYLCTYLCTLFVQSCLHMLLHPVHAHVYICICIGTSQSQPTVCRNRDFKFVHCSRSSALILHLSPPPLPLLSSTPPLPHPSSPPPLLSSTPLFPPYPLSLSSIPFPISLLPSLSTPLTSPAYGESGLEQTPTKRLTTRAPHIAKPGDVTWAGGLSGEQDTLLSAVMHRLKGQVQQRRILTKPCFQDFDK